MLDGYVRVSQVAGRSGERFISPSLQREQIHGWAAMRGVLIGEVFEELDESGGRGDRPKLLQAIERIENGQSKGIIVARLDRFGRSLRDGLAAIERIREANGTFVSVQDGLDLSTDTGKLVFHILLSMGEWELDRIRTTWKIAKARAIARGVHVGSTPPFGYRRDPSGRLRVDPSCGWMIQPLFERRAEGATFSELGRWLESNGALTSRGNPGWRDTTVRGVLMNRVYLGELRSGVEVARRTHAPLVDRGTWQRAQRPRTSKESHEKTPTLLGGLLRCWGCRMVLNSQTVTTSSGRRIAAYACHERSSRGQCSSAAYVTGPVIEPHIEQAFFAEVQRRERRSQASGARLHALQERLDAAEAALDLYRDSPRTLQALGEDRYVAGLQARARALDLAAQSFATEERRVDSVPMPTSGDLEDRWPSMTVEQRRATIGQLVDCVFVRRGWSRINQRVFVCFRGQQPPDLPARGARRLVSYAFDPRAVPGRRKARTPKRWRTPRIEEKLRAFLGNRPNWPPPEEFTSTGNGPLYAQIVRSGGPEYWALRMSVRSPRKKQGMRVWDRDLAEQTLRGFLRGREWFPTRREFTDHGYRGLYNWLDKHGGIPRWAGMFHLHRKRQRARRQQRDPSIGS